MNDGRRPEPRGTRHRTSVFLADEQSRRVPDERLRDLAGHVLAARGVPRSMELNVLLVERGVMAELNAQHMGGDGPTDVLAFPMDAPGESLPGEPAILGDVVVCPDVAAAQAVEHGVDELAEVELLVVHGILHLLGFDHAAEADKREMFDLTDALLASFRGPA